MANIKISDLTGASAAADANELEINEAGTSKKLTVAQVSSKVISDIVTADITALGALMDSELTSIASVKALNQGVTTGDSPTFAGLTTTADASFGDNDKAIFGAGSDLQIYHDGTNSAIQNSTGELFIYGGSNQIRIRAENGEESIVANPNASVDLYYNNSKKLDTTNTGVSVTGTVTATAFAGDGSALTGVAGGSSTDHLAVGTYHGLAAWSSADMDIGATLAGSSLRYKNLNSPSSHDGWASWGTSTSSTSTVSGTWRNMSTQNWRASSNRGQTTYYAGLWVRIS